MVHLQILREIWMTHLPVVMNKRYSKYIQHILIKKFCATNMSLLPYSNNLQILLSGARLEEYMNLIKSDSKDIYNATKDLYLHLLNIMFWTFHSPKIPQKVLHFKCFQISISWFLKDHVELKVGVIAAENSDLPSQEWITSQSILK